MVFFPVLVSPFVALAAAANRRSREGGRRPANREPYFHKNCDDAKLILRGYITGQWNDWITFRDTNPALVRTADRPTAKYKRGTINRQYHAVIKRYNRHMDPNDSYDGQLVVPWSVSDFKFFGC